MDKKIKVIALIFGIVLIGHLLRFIFKVPVVIGNFSVPLYFSLFPIIFLIILIAWLIKK